ncbi:putative acyl-CoA dehydrogenase [Actinoplanes missouriensis 431]|uniref:Dibenzothiophene monooxygenase n=1 Tax=Actinoplanes missouriensis (strain ATCC 14538 / DSM 43046 / CBS 188.64 / JCM 3121 / NBRC 102363 / NCIMB 12654 / NRRL B-3342 / UNCC 431) TaxID=512565 RepID=I0HD50_ACTM4|nr:acyl-CoA dehydrogenase family protein [Actinoplanes missouriensis]BAL90937.1 putative acyl-CoA dehydrogenase [Actinoplanes missouriensis 431]
MADRLIGEKLVDDMTVEEKSRAALVEQVLPALRARAEQADADGAFPREHIDVLREAGLLGLIVPEEYGGLGGTLRDLAAATYAMGSACPSTALAFFFHNTSASRGLLPLEAIEAGLFADEEVPVVTAFAERVLRLMSGGTWLANFASESVKSSGANIAIATTAVPATRDGVAGWELTGEKSFGCATGIADYYLVTARLDGYDTAEGLVMFLVPREAPGVTERPFWDGLGMRGSANHGIKLNGVFIPQEDALTVPGAFVKMLQCSRGSFVGNQLAITAVYVGAAQGVYDDTLERLTTKTFADTGRPVAESPMHQVIIGDMTESLERAYLWLRRQLLLETVEPPIATKSEVYAQWRIAKGSICQAAFDVALGAFKASGTSGATMNGVVGRALRDLAMGLVMTFPPERGRLEAASVITSNKANELFTSVAS